MHPGDSHTQFNHLSPTYKLHVCLHRGACVFRVQIWASSPRPLRCLSTLERVCACVYFHVIFPCVWLSDLCVPACASASCCPRKSFEPSPGKPLGTGSGRLRGMCVHKLSDGFVSITAAFGPGAMTEDQNREFLQRSSRFSADRAQLTHF